MAISTNADDDVLSEINVTPLVDVMLVLLVAFIVTAPLMNNAIQVNLPKTAATKAPEQKKPVTVSVDAAGKLFIDRQEYPLETIEPELKKLHDNNPDVTLHLSSDEAVNYGKVAKVMAAIERAGITRVAVLTQGE
ncbi:MULTISPECIES: biopolymer transporter ExbD [unclassified Methylophilus]|jgi:biopolymer transport protein ExbD/biopolymer transport protein TolR|uniref:ExbD/TolR family protein n=1 Tax=unclassified Methylophilus TaxID=2630143 RepID=UPI000363366F|nr:MULTISPECIES: biopolymer transporter ExbD [unclassified Methylophilus]